MKLAELLKIEAEMPELRGAVAQSILDNVDSENDLVGFMNDVMQHGCISGCVSGMIYYRETVAFYDKYRENIEDMLLNYGMDQEYEKMNLIMDCEYDEELEEEYEIDVTTEKNRLAWMAYELVLSDIYNEYEMEQAS